jgi:hypothetical protein
MNEMTHQRTENHSKGSDKAAHPQFDETPSAGVLKHSEKCSVIARPAIKQASIPSSSKAEER